ncbi:MAG: AAA family ATPase [Candidatus Bathyarchaeota archaeon]|nr:AAA family ATPase [Candidatus Bathyarchaeota archaeon]
MYTDKLVIGLTGMPGAGKSIVVQATKDWGYNVVVMGDVIREETRNRGLELTPQNVGKVMLQLREESGPNVIAQKCVPKIAAQNNHKIIIDGLRSYAEAEVFMANFANFVLVTVHAPPQLRFERLNARGRSDDSPSFEVFHERDMRELGVGMGAAIGLSEYVIVNDGTIDEVKCKAKAVLGRIEEKWSK